MKSTAVSFILVTLIVAGPASTRSLDASEVASSEAEMVTSVSQHGITWTFDRTYEAGQFVNGDWWVLGPVDIIAIDPASTNGLHGSSINPRVGPQGYDERLSTISAGWYDASLNVAADVSDTSPLTVTPGSSLVSSKSKSSTAVRPYIETAAVLTVLAKIPPSGSFRPPFAGDDKTVRHNTSQLDYDSLQLLPPFNSAPDFPTVERYFQRPWLDLAGSGYQHQYQAPDENMRNYGRDMAAEVELGALLLLLDYPHAQKQNLLVNFIQVGIDLYGIVTDGGGQDRWLPGGGHNSGRKWPIVFAGIMLDDEGMKSVDASFQEDGQTYYGTTWNGATVLWGTRHGYMPGMDHEHKHPSQWTTSGNSDKKSESYRHCCSGVSWVGMVLAARVMGAESVWNHPPFFDYVDRWMTEDWEPYHTIVVQELGSSPGNNQGKVSHQFIRDVWDAVHGAEPTVATPTVNPNGGGFSGAVTVQLATTTSGAEIRYTIDGSVPLETSSLYTGPFNLQSSVTLKAKAFKSGITPSGVATASFTITIDTTAPTLLSASAIADPSLTKVVFSESVEASSATTLGNYRIDPNVTLSSVELEGDGRTATLHTSALSQGITYTVTVNDVEDLSGNPIAANSQATLVYIPVDISEGLVGYWPFDEGAGSDTADLSGGNHDGLLAGATWISEGKVGAGLEFDGIDDSVDTGPWDVAGQALTVALWMRADDFEVSDARLLSKAAGVSEQDHYWMLSTLSQGDVKLRFRLKAGGSTSTLIAGGSALAPDVWAHVAAVYDGSTMKLYQDGVEVGSQAKSGALDTNDQISVWVGRNPDGSRPFDGALDEVRIYDRALTPSEIQALVTPSPSDELITDFGASGFWHYGAGWSKAAGWDPVDMERWSSKSAVDFGPGKGLWTYESSGWSKISSWSSYDLVAWGDKLAAGFDAGRGLWLYDGTSWAKLTSWEPTRMAAFGNRLAAAFGAEHGMWLYDGSWTKITTWDPYRVVTWGSNLVAAFDAGRGLWMYDGTSWTKLSSWEPTQLVAAGDQLAASFGAGLGTYTYDAGGWKEISSWEPYHLVAWGDKLAAAFDSGRGLYLYEGSSWSRISNWEPVDMDALGQTLAVAFGSGRGVYTYHHAWKKISSWDAEKLERVSIY